MQAQLVYQSTLKCYMYDGIFGLKKNWKKCYIVLHSDSKLSVYKSERRRTKLCQCRLDELALWLAFGKDAEKYDPPVVDLSHLIDRAYLIAIPEDSTRQNIRWFAAGSQQQFKELIRAIAVTVKSTSRPPVVGGKRYESKFVKDRIKHIFNLGDETEDWEIYWLAGSIGESGAEMYTSKPPTPLLSRSQAPTPLPTKSPIVWTPLGSLTSAPSSPTSDRHTIYDELCESLPSSPLFQRTQRPPLPVSRQSTMSARVSECSDDTLKMSEHPKHPHEKVKRTTTIIIVGKERVPLVPHESKAQNGTLHYQVQKPEEFLHNLHTDNLIGEVREVLTDEQKWHNNYCSGTTIKSVEYSARNFNHT